MGPLHSDDSGRPSLCQASQPTCRRTACDALCARRTWPSAPLKTKGTRKGSESDDQWATQPTKRGLESRLVGNLHKRVQSRCAKLFGGRLFSIRSALGLDSTTNFKGLLRSAFFSHYVLACKSSFCYRAVCCCAMLRSFIAFPYSRFAFTSFSPEEPTGIQAKTSFQQTTDP